MSTPAFPLPVFDAPSAGEALSLQMMRRAVELAARALGQTRPNPAVGCVLAKGERIIAEGFHARAGEPHAEAMALRACTEDPQGATAYVTLEPCRHVGRTPPCVEALLNAGIGKVVIAQRDPNVAARGGLERLREAGVEVETGVLALEAAALNAAFNTFFGLGRPLVTLKWAMSADGLTSPAAGQSAWITAEAARERSHRMRAEHDAVLVGIETLLKDNARLSVRGVPLPPGPPPRRMVLDTRLRLPVEHPFVAEEQGIATVLCGEDAPADRRAALENRGVEVWPVSLNQDGHVSLPGALRTLRERGVQSVFCEGGRRLAGAMFAAGTVDRVAVFQAPVLIGAGGETLSPLLVPNPALHMDEAVRLHHTAVELIPPDLLLTGWVSTHLFEPL